MPSGNIANRAVFFQHIRKPEYPPGHKALFLHTCIHHINHAHRSLLLSEGLVKFLHAHITAGLAINRECNLAARDRVLRIGLGSNATRQLGGRIIDFGTFMRRKHSSTHFYCYCYCEQ